MMDYITRREEILRILKASKDSVSANQFAERFGVTRQIIVSDIALLRANGHRIAAGRRGYQLEETALQGRLESIVCRHRSGDRRAALRDQPIPAERASGDYRRLTCLLAMRTVRQKHQVRADLCRLCQERREPDGRQGDPHRGDRRRAGAVFAKAGQDVYGRQAPLMDDAANIPGRQGASAGDFFITKEDRYGNYRWLYRTASAHCRR